MAELIPFSHHWTISNFTFLSGNNIICHPSIKTEIKCSDSNQIELLLFPKGISFDSAEYISLQFKNENQLYAKVWIQSESGSKKNITENFSKLNILEFQNFILCSQLLAQKKSLLPKNELIVCCTGVICKTANYDLAKNADLITEKIAFIKTTYDHFNFQIPSSYFTTEWAIDRFNEQFTKKAEVHNHFIEKDSETKFCIQLLQHSFDSKYVSLCLQLINCRKDKLNLWFDVSIIGADETIFKPFRSIKIFENGTKIGNPFFINQSKTTDLLAETNQIKFKIEMIEINKLIAASDLSKSCLENYTTIFKFLSSNWKKAALNYAENSDDESEYDDDFQKEEKVSKKNAQKSTNQSQTNVELNEHEQNQNSPTNEFLPDDVISQFLQNGQFRHQFAQSLSKEIYEIVNQHLDSSTRVQSHTLNLHNVFLNSNASSTFSDFNITDSAVSVESIENLKAFIDKSLKEIQEKLNKLASLEEEKMQLLQLIKGEKEANEQSVNVNYSMASESVSIKNKTINFTVKITQNQGNTFAVNVSVPLEDSEHQIKPEVAVKRQPNVIQPQQLEELNANQPSIDLSQYESDIPLSDRFIIRSWAYLFLYSNLDQVRQKMSETDLKQIRYNAERITKNYQEKRKKIKHRKYEQIVLLSDLIIKQINELIDTKGWASSPIQYIKAEHLINEKDEE